VDELELLHPPGTLVDLADLFREFPQRVVGVVLLAGIAVVTAITVGEKGSDIFGDFLNIGGRPTAAGGELDRVDMENIRVEGLEGFLVDGGCAPMR
jgi:hypothetical protein